MKVERVIPGLGWIKNYPSKYLSKDITAGIVVGIMLIPQSMAYAMIAGLPPVYGLYASIVPTIVYALMGTSRQLAVGPVAMDSFLVGATVSLLAIPGTENYIHLAIVLAFLIGIIQLIFGFARLGFLINFLSKPVIVGFTSAAAIIISVNQIALMTGIPIGQNNQLHYVFYDLILNLKKFDIQIIIFASSSIAIIYLLKNIHKKIPAALVVVLVGTMLTYFFNLHEGAIQVIGEIPQGVPTFAFPEFSLAEFKMLVPAALALALIGFMESITISKTIEEKNPENVSIPNKELVALGSSNLVGSLFSSYPVAGGFSRTAVNFQSGAKTQLSGIITAIVILLSVLFLTDALYFVPRVILGVIIFLAVITLIDFKAPLQWWRTDKKEFLMYAATLLATCFIGIQEGIIIGVLISIVLLIYKVSTPHMAVVGKIPGTNLYRNVERFADVETDKEVLIVRFDAGLFYGNADYFKDKLIEFSQAKGANLKAIIVDASGINSIDSTSIYMIRKLLIQFRRKKVKVLFSGLIGPVRDSFNQNRIYTELGEEFFFVNIEDAERYLKGQPCLFNGDVARQSNFKLRVKRN